MAVSRYKLATNAAAHVTGTKTLLLAGTPGYSAVTPAPPTGLPSCVTFAFGNANLYGSLPDSDYGNLNDVWFDVYFYKFAGEAVNLFAAYPWYWSTDFLYAVKLSCTASGGVGLGDGTSYAGLAAGKTADGLVTDNAWHRIRFEWPAGSVVGSAKLFIGNDRHNVTPNATVATTNFFDSATYNWDRVILRFFESGITRLSDAAYGVMSTDAIPARSATDWAVSAGQATGAVTIGGTANGARYSYGQASGPVAIGGTASGTRYAFGQADGVVTIGGTASGSANMPGGAGLANGGVTVGGTASGTSIASTSYGQAIGTVTVGGSVNGQTFTPGSYWGDLEYWPDLETWWSPWRRGQGVSGVTVGGTASGSAIPPPGSTGTAQGAVTISGTASGIALPPGATTGALGVVTIGGTASGSAILPSTGGAAGSITVSGNASGSALPPPAVATAAVVVGGVASGYSIQYAQALGAVAIGGIAFQGRGTMLYTESRLDTHDDSTTRLETGSSG
jgi:hypothetical protein